MGSMNTDNFFSRPLKFGMKALNKQQPTTPEKQAELPKQEESPIKKFKASPSKNRKTILCIDSDGEDEIAQSSEDCICVENDKSYDDLDPFLADAMQSSTLPPAISPKSAKTKTTLFIHDHFGNAAKEAKIYKFITHSHDTFEKVLDYLSKQLFTTEKNMILSYKGVIIMKFSTAESLGMADGARLDLYSRRTWDQLQQQIEEQKTKDLKQSLQEPFTGTQEFLFSQAEELKKKMSGASEPVSVKQMYVNVRDCTKNIVAVPVDSSSQISTILHKYYEITGLPSSPEAYLVFDGEELSLQHEISSVLECDDLVDLKMHVK